jgi:hypothetical protein
MERVKSMPSETIFRIFNRSFGGFDQETLMTHAFLEGCNGKEHATWSESTTWSGDHTLGDESYQRDRFVNPTKITAKCDGSCGKKVLGYFVFVPK